jgi:predicted XRE-type DNA-binding protein
MTKHEPLAVTQGSGNVFADLGYASPHVHQAKAVLAAEIIKALDAGALTVRKAEARTGIAAADFSRIRNADLGRFTIDRLIRILERLDAKLDVQVTVRHQGAAQAPLLAP